MTTVYDVLKLSRREPAYLAKGHRYAVVVRGSGVLRGTAETRKEAEALAAEKQAALANPPKGRVRRALLG